MTLISRRGVLTAALGAVGGIGLVTIGQDAAYARTPGETPSAVPKAAPWTAATSANGWPVVVSEGVGLHRIEGSQVSVALLDGPVATVLGHVVRRYCYEVDSSLSNADVTGHTTHRTVAAAMESNQLSGTAVVIRPGAYPLGARDGFYPQEVAVIRDILAECGGVVRWGRDEAVPKESHFQIDVTPDDRRLPALAAQLTAWRRVIGRGPGSIDVSQPTRRKAARAMTLRQAS